MMHSVPSRHDNPFATCWTRPGAIPFRFENGVMALIGATPDGYREKSTFEIPGVEQPSWSHPVIVGGKLYLREQDALYCYDVKG